MVHAIVVGSRQLERAGGKSGLHRAGIPFVKEGYCGLYSTGRLVQQKIYRLETGKGEKAR